MAANICAMPRALAYSKDFAHNWRFSFVYSRCLPATWLLKRRSSVSSAAAANCSIIERLIQKSVTMQSRQSKLKPEHKRELASLCTTFCTCFYDVDGLFRVAYIMKKVRVAFAYFSLVSFRSTWGSSHASIETRAIECTTSGRRTRHAREYSSVYSSERRRDASVGALCALNARRRRRAAAAVEPSKVARVRGDRIQATTKLLTAFQPLQSLSTVCK